MGNFIPLAPDPKSHIKTLTRIGYTLPSAVSDILDNSIAAGSSNIALLSLPGEGEQSFSIIDDGEGMCPKELLQNMRIGCKDPSDERGEEDLGRFGSGMKTASFSQARRLTVVSKSRNNRLSAASWDLDEIESRNEWCVQVLDDSEIAELPNLELGDHTPHGTQIIWEKLTFIPQTSHSESAEKEMARALAELETHIGLHFHRFMTGKNKCHISINNAPVAPIDPFLTGHPGYQEGRIAKNRCKGGHIVIQTHVLPHVKKISRNELAKLGGAEGISQNQGIYIYRNKRLIHAGGWLGLNTSNQLHALARVQVDVPSSLDHEWKTDVKKASLQLPSRVQRDLKKYLADPVKKSRKVYSYRGKQDTANEYWRINEREDTGIITYEISSENTSLQKILEETPQHTRSGLVQYLADLAAHLPLNHIYEKMSSSPREIDQTASPQDMSSLLKKIFAKL